MFDDVEDLLDDDRCQAQGRLVQQQQLGLAHQRPADGEHLLLAAGHGAAALAEAFLEAGEQVQHLVHLFLVIALVGKEPTHGQVLFHGQARKHSTAFRYHRNALAHDLGGVLAHQFFTHVADAATVGLRRTAQGHQQGRFAGTVGADQGDNLTLAHFHIDAVQGLDLAVESGNVFELQHFTLPPSRL